MRRKVLDSIMKFCLGVFLVLAGCGGGGGGGTSPGSGSGSAITEVSSTVKAQGGTISVSDASSGIKGFRMVIPDGALSNPTNISVQTNTGFVPLPVPTSLSGSIIELLPAGLTFNKPISISVPYTGDNPPTIVTYNTSYNTYSILPVTNIDPQSKTITVITKHFTKLIRIYGETSKTLSTGFTLTDDAFKINNRPGIMEFTNNPRGACWGFSYYSKWYFEHKKSVDGKLYGRYKNEASIVSDAQDTQSEDLTIINNSIALLNKFPGYKAHNFQSLYNAMMINKTPQVLLACDSSNMEAARLRQYRCRV